MSRGPIAARMGLLWRRRPVRIALLLALGAAALAPLLPLAGVPGFESALIANLIAAPLAGALGIAAARQEAGLGDAPAHAAVGRAIVASWSWALVVVAAFALAALVAGIFGAPCALADGLPWYVVLPLPSALLAAAVGFFCGALTHRRRLPGLLLAAAFVLSFLTTALPVLTGPQVFLYDHLLGHWPGPLYDEVVQIRSPLLVFRGLTLTLAAAVAASAALCWRDGRMGRPRRRAVPGVVLLVAVALLVAGFASRHEAGWVQSNASVERALGGRTEGRRCTVIHPRGLARRSLELFVAECDARVEELESFFATEAARPTVFLYADREEKGRLVGASGTQFAKPWLQQIHVDDRGFPHPVLKHELAHLVTGHLGRPPFGVSAALFGLLPLQGLVEGAAVAADWPAGELTVHEEARALRALGLAPAIPRIMSATGFYTQSASRAYSYAGSFVRWLVERHGADAFARLYWAGDFHAAYGTSLQELVGAWEAWLDEAPLREEALAVAERRFRRPPIFARPCAREVAALSREAAEARKAGDAELAVDLYARCAVLDPGDPAPLLGQAAALADVGAAEQVEALWEALDAHPSAGALLRARMLEHLGDAWAHRGEALQAADAWQRAASFAADASTLRSLEVKEEAVQDRAIASVVLPWLARSTDARLIGVRALLDERPDYATGWYLVGRRLLQRDEWEQAVIHLDRALEVGLPTERLQREALRQRALALLALGRYGAAERDLLAAAGGPAGEELRTGDLLGLVRHAAR